MIEKHPFRNFVPKNANYLLLGSFAGRNEPGYNWFYSNSRNHFWPIIEKVYNRKLPTIKSRQVLFSKLGIAISDVILSCERKKKDNADTSLVNCTFNIKAISKILAQNKISTIFFSSKFTEGLFRRHFKVDQEVYFVTLPSPSPRYARMSKAKKISFYKALLPKLEK